MCGVWGRAVRGSPLEERGVCKSPCRVLLRDAPSMCAVALAAGH